MNFNLFLSIYRIGFFKNMFKKDTFHFKKVSSYLERNKKIKEGPFYVPLDILESLLLSIPSSKNETLVIKEISESIRVFDLGTVGYYLYSCKHIVEAIKSYACFSMLISNFIHYDISKEGNKLVWEARYNEAEKIMSNRGYRLFLALETSVRHSVVCKLLGHEIDCIVKKKKLIYHFKNNNLSLTSANDKLNKELENILVDVLLEKENIVSLVKIFFKNNLWFEKISIEKLSTFLNMSDRSVQRCLKKENTSYKKLLIEVRKELAEHYLRQKLPMKKIAINLGYQDVGSFFRAFKGWYGCSTHEFTTVSYCLSI